MSYLAFDDGYFPVRFKGHGGYTALAGVLVNGKWSVRKIAIKLVLVDGGASERAIVELARRLGGGGIVLLDGVTYSGFDVVDPWSVSSEAGAPVIVVQFAPPDAERAKRALLKHFEDGAERLKRFERALREMRPMITPWRTLWVLAAGMEAEEAMAVVRELAVFSPIPEPLRIAHSVASAVSRALTSRLIEAGIGARPG